MNKIVRILIAIMFVAGILFLARSQVAGAGDLPARHDNNHGQAGARPAAAVEQPGSVRPPADVILLIAITGGYPVGGVCDVRVIRLSEGFTLSAELRPYADLTDFLRKDGDLYLAGVCQITFFKDGLQIPELAAAAGEVNICFAGVPNTEGRIHVFDGQDYTHLETWTEGSLKCSDVSKPVEYFLAAAP